MAPEAHWEKAKEICDSALALPAAEREPYLDQACAGDVPLRAKVNRLLSEHEAGDTLPTPRTEPELALQPGDRLSARYTVTRLIGRGGMGEVYEVVDDLLKESIALKTLRGDLSGDETIARHFQKEIQLARKVTHPGVCRVFEAGVHEFADGWRPPVRFFTMELLLGGETLSARIRRLKRIPRAQAFPIAVQMAEGLQAAHDAGVVHADFKSGNVMLIPAAGGERVVITDFGLARIDPTRTSDETRTLSTAQKIRGTVAYMSPEQMTGGTITTASDIYSFGIVLYEMATGTLPFDVHHMIHAAVQRVSGEGVTARSLVSDIDSRWDSAIERCLEKDPARRFHSAGDLADWFRTGAWWKPRYWTRREWVYASGAAVVLSAGGGGYWLRSRQPYRANAAALELYGKGTAALHSMTYEAARKALEQAVAADPKLVLAHAGLARAYDEMDYSERAKESMLRALTVAHDTPLSEADARRLHALQLVVSRDYDKAAPMFQAMENAAEDRAKAAAALESGWLAEKRDKTDEAAAAYARALKADPGYAAAKLRLGFILGRRRDLVGALKAFAEAEARYAASSDYEGVTETLWQRANLLSRSGRAAEAMPVIEKALAGAQTVGNTYQQIRSQLLRGSATASLGDAKRAGELAREAIDAADAQRMDNLASSGLVELGNSFLRRGDLVSAEPLYARALELASRGKVGRYQARARFSLGSVCEQSNRPEQARQFFEAALLFYRQGGYRREVVSAMTGLGSAHQQLAEFDQSIRILREALAEAVQIKEALSEAQVRERLGGSLRHQGLWPNAVIEYEHAVRLLGAGPESAFARRNCAALYWRLGRRPDAQRTLADVEGMLARRLNAVLLFDLRLEQAEMAYADGRLADAVSFSKSALAAIPGGGDVAESKARLIEVLAALRNRRIGGNPDVAERLVEGLERGKLLSDAAAGRLAVAQALMAAGERAPALRMALEALKFYEPRRIWESVWRARAVAAQASTGTVEAEIHKAAAGSARRELKGLWSQEDWNSYHGRRDIQQAAAGLPL